jgi:molybdopterin converting factor small subunit
MRPHTQIHLFGSLQKKMEDTFDLPIRFDHAGPMPLLDVLTRFNIPPGMVQLTMVNHKAVHKDTVIHPGDRVAVFPREYIVFTDWKDFRF